MRSSCCSSLVTQVQVPRPHSERSRLIPEGHPPTPVVAHMVPPSLPPSSASRAHIKSNDIRKENLIVKVTFIFYQFPCSAVFHFLNVFFSEALCPRESVLVCIMYVCTMPSGHYSVVLWSHNSWASSCHCSRHTHLRTRYTSNFTACRVCCFLWRVLGGDAADSKLFIEWQLRKLSRIIAHKRL